MVKTMVEQILETMPNKEVYPDYYIVGEQGENNLLVFKDVKGKIIGFTLIEPEQEKENDKGKKNISRNVSS